MSSISFRPIPYIPLPSPRDPSSKSHWQFNESNLYGNYGRPVAADIRQTSIGDCCLASFLGSTAMEQPSRIEDAIQFDEATGNFTVTLYKQVNVFGMNIPIPVQVTVTQQELQQNIQAGGASWIDDTGSGACWPAVMETAYANLLDGNPNDGLQEGFDVLGGIGAQQSVQMLAGVQGEHLAIDNADLDQLSATIMQALAQGKPVTICGHPEANGVQDGLVDMHDYMVESIWRDDETGQIMVRVRNPWANNVDGDEGNRPGATMDIPLSSIQSGDFDVGVAYQS